MTHKAKTIVNKEGGKRIALTEDEVNYISRARNMDCTDAHIAEEFDDEAVKEVKVLYAQAVLGDDCAPITCDDDEAVIDGEFRRAWVKEYYEKEWIIPLIPAQEACYLYSDGLHKEGAWPVSVTYNIEMEDGTTAKIELRAGPGWWYSDGPEASRVVPPDADSPRGVQHVVLVGTDVAVDLAGWAVHEALVEIGAKEPTYRRGDTEPLEWRPKRP